MPVIMKYYGLDLLDQVQEAYRKRYDLAVERGFDEPNNKYYWLFEELQYRLQFLRQMILFIHALSSFILSGSENDALGYVVRYSTRFFSNTNCGEVTRENDQHPYFNDANGYYCDFTEALNHFDSDYDFSNHPLFLVDLTECAVRAARLHLQIREHQFHAIDRDKFDALMQMRVQLPASA